MRRFFLALGFLTRLPVPQLASKPEDFAKAVRLYPLVGLVIGAIIGAIGIGAARLDPWIGALAALIAWVWATGALHLDGLGDVADGLGAAHGDRARLLAVMTDPHIGSFGVVAIVLQLVAKLVLLHIILADDGLPLIAVPAIARLGPLVWSRVLPSLKTAGLGVAITGATRFRDLIGWTALLVAAAVIFPGLLAGLVLIAVLALLFRNTLGGMTGDVHGAGIELTESGLLLVLAALATL